MQSSGGLTRRQALRWSAAAAASAVAGGVLTACAGRGQAAPARSLKNPVILTWQPGTPGIAAGLARTAQEILYQMTAPFRKANPGVEIKLVFPMGFSGANVTGLAAAYAAGTGPDVAELSQIPWVYPRSNFLLDLEPYVRADNLDVTVWPASAMEFCRSLSALGKSSTGLYYLPAYVNVLAMAVNNGLIDNLGFLRPQPDWTYAEWAGLAQKLTKPGNNPRAGMLLYWTELPPSFLLHAFGGGYVDPTNNSRSGLTAPGTVAFFQWLTPLLNQGSVVTGNPWVQGLGSGYCGTELYQSAFMLEAIQQFAGLDWDFYLPPVGSAGRFTAGYLDVIGVSAGTKHPQLAYEFAKWLTWDKTFASGMMQLSLRSPIRNDQWPQWIDTIKSVAPPLQNKNLSAFADLATGVDGSTWAQRYFRYGNTAAVGIINSWLQKMFFEGVSPVEALTEADHQITSLETAMQAAQP